MDEREYAEKTNGGELAVCTGDLLDGLDIDIVAYSGFGELTDEQHDKLWAEMTDIGLVELCSNCELLETGEWDAPGQSTIFYSLVTNDAEAFKLELRQHINTILTASHTSSPGYPKAQTHQ